MEPSNWHRPALTGVLVFLLTATMLLADDQQATKSSLDKATRLQRILNNEVPRDVDDLKVMQEHIRILAKKSLDVTVAIGRRTQGSGVIISEDGYVLTAAHVAGRPNRPVDIVLPDGRTVQGYTLGSFKSVDAGLVKIGSPNDDEGSKVKWPFAEMGDSRKAQLGQWCLATGHPGGFQPERKPVLRVGRLIHKYKDVLTTDCTIISGDSGGPLFDLQGKVIGIHSRIGFELRHNVHVPVHLYQDNWQRLIDAEIWGTTPASPFIGVSGPNEKNRTQVKKVEPGKPADKAGIEVGDIIIKFGDDQVTDFNSLIALVGLRRPGEKVAVTVMRRKKKVVLTLTVGSREDKSSAAAVPSFWTWLQAAPAEQPPDQRSAVQQTATGAAYLGMWQQISLLRPVSVNQRNHSSIRKSFRDVVAGSVKSTVKVFAGDQQVALGVVVDRDGYILTKASQIPGPVKCQFSNGERVVAKVVNIQTRHDLALLKVDLQGLTAIEWNRDGKVPVGSWLAVPSHLAEPLAIGVLS
ncbi:MAG: trypsin-like peptidase domain-containing protein, partial [Pirellulaceae bacterium]